MAPKYHPTPLSGGDRKALSKELVKARAMTGILAERSQEKRRVGEALIREADNLACQTWNEKMWSDGGPAQPSPTIGQAIKRGILAAIFGAPSPHPKIPFPAGGLEHEVWWSLRTPRKVLHRRDD
jgi:hypothetical protein